MGRPARLLAKKSAICVAALCAAAALPGCSASRPAAPVPAGSPSAASRPARSPASGSPASAGSASPAAAAGARPAFTVTGVHPVAPSGSQDTYAQTPGASCDGASFAADRAVGVKVARGFALTGFPVAADLLEHFLGGTGTAVRYPAGSPISKQAQASAAFQVVAREVSAAILSQLRTGQVHVRLSAALLPTVAFESTGTDLYWGFRGTQGLTVTGSGHRQDGRYVGTLSYVIQDSYGFPAGDTLAGFGPPMRYLQTVCGAPQHAGGARWFPDAITLTVPFSQPAR
jgi:hypothetical protein